MADPALQRDLFLLAGYLLSSARGLYDEPAGYGPFRLLDAARRLVALMAEHGLGDPYVAALQGELERACTGTASDAELQELADRLVLEYAKELERRLSPGGRNPTAGEGAKRAYLAPVGGYDWDRVSVGGACSSPSTDTHEVSAAPAILQHKPRRHRP